MQSNIKNQTIFHADNLDVLQGMDSESVDLIYLDPPFAKNETFVNSDKNKIEKLKTYFKDLQKNGLFPKEKFDEIFKEEVQFEDIWRHTDIHQKYYSQINEHNNELISYLDSIRNYSKPGTFYYLIYMAVRIKEMYRILKDTGSIYLHCDHTASHYIKSILDKIFGYKNFRSEIVWGYRTQGVSKKWWPRKHDIIFMYSKSNLFTFHPLMERQYYSKPFRHTKIDEKNRHYVDSYVRDVWDHDETKPKISQSSERMGYPTQKPLALLERIIKASSNEGDVVLDPFCGCATTCHASERVTNRKWIGIDINIQAFYMIYYRLANDKDIKMGTDYRADMLGRNLTLETKIPTRTDSPSKEPARKVAEYELTSYEISMPSTLSHKQKVEIKHSLYQKQSGMCNGCDAYNREVDLTIDHIKPQKDGVDNRIENLQLLCYRCNNWKRAGTMKELFDKLRDSNIIPEGVYKKQLKLHNG